MQTTHFTIYQTTNKLNGKIYIGMHKTQNLDDGYIGSGKHLWRSINKYGIENFEKEILFIFESEQEMFDKEKELVTEEFCKRKDTYNICRGGMGGFSYINRKGLGVPNFRKDNAREYSAAGKEAKRIKAEQDPEWVSRVKKNLSVSVKLSYLDRDGTFKGKSHSDETKKKMSEKAKQRSSGSRNSQFGSMWVTNEEENKKIPKDSAIPDGWRKGRKMNPVKSGSS